MKYLKMRRWRTGSPGSFYPVILGRRSKHHRNWTILRVGHSFDHWQSSDKEGRALLKEARREGD